jgi:ATP/ADP translocase/HEAT repeat protein
MWTRIGLVFPRIERGEGALLASLTALHFLVILSFTLARIARDGFLLSRMAVQHLPWVSLGLAAWMVLAAAAFGRLAAGRATHQALAGAFLATGLSLPLFALWFRAGGTGAAVAFYLWTGAYGLLLVSQFWLLANERLNAQQARRLFGPIGAGGVVGGLAAGAVASLPRRIAPELLLLVLAGIHVVAAGLASRSGIREEEKAPSRNDDVQEEGLRSALRRPYVRQLVLLFLAGGVASGVLDYVFKLALQTRTGDAARLTSLLGLFYGAQNLLALVAQLGIAGVVLARVGARHASILLPGGLFAGSVLTVFAPSFASVLGTRLYEATMRVSLARTASEFLFFPLPDGIRRPAKRFIDGVVARAGDAVAGLLVLGLIAIAGGTAPQLAALVAAVCLAWLALERMVDRSYAREVSLSIDRMLLPGARPGVSLQEAGALAELLPLLGSDNERRVLYALDQLQAVAPDALRERAEALLSHPSTAVRARALTLPALQGGRGQPPALPSQESGTEGPSGPTVVAPNRSAASAASAAPQLARRMLAVRLDDPDPVVRRAAFTSLAQAGERESVPLLVGRLAWPRDRADVRQALVTYGDRIVGTLGDALDDPHVPLAARREIPRVLALIGTQAAAFSLLRGIGHPRDVVLLQRTFWGLTRIRKNDDRIALPEPFARARIHEEVDVYLRILVQGARVADLPEGGARRLLARALAERLTQSRERVFRGLALLYAPRDLLRAHRGLISRNPRIRAQSLEFLDTVLLTADREVVRPLLDQGPEEDRVRRAASRVGLAGAPASAVLRELCASGDPWLRACALHAVGDLGFKDATDPVAAALRAPDPIVRETAAWARRQIEEPA